MYARSLVEQLQSSPATHEADEVREEDESSIISMSYPRSYKRAQIRHRVWVIAGIHV